MSGSEWDPCPDNDDEDWIVDRDELIDEIACLEQDIEQLRVELLICSELASGKHHMAPSDRCAAICCHVHSVLSGKKRDDTHEQPPAA